MMTEIGSQSHSSIRLPRHLFLFVLLTCEATPFLARLPGAIAHGLSWLTDYFPGVGIAAFNLIPVGVLYGIGKASKRRPLAFWFAMIAAIEFLAWGHGLMNLRASSTAAIGLVFIPIYGAGAAILGWVTGLIVNAVLRSERARAWFAGVVATALSVLVVSLIVYDTQDVAQRESKFPVVSVQEIPLDKRVILQCCSLGRVEVLRLGNFDADPEDEIAVLGDTGVKLLELANYKVKATFDLTRCSDGCIGMYPDLVADGKGDFLIVSSEGVANSSGKLLWALKSDSFRRLVPVQIPGSREPNFLAGYVNQRVERRDATGKILWAADITALNEGSYVGPNGDHLFFVLTPGGSNSLLLRFYDLDGKRKKDIALPGWTSNVQQIAWPSPGHLLIGSGPNIGVFDSYGKQVLVHTIRATSFSPYHGPDGTAVRLDPAKEPYLAVVSHGSSGYARSVLLIFDPNGHLVWQEELDKIRTVLTVRRPDGKGEALLVGGMSGVIEYRLATGFPEQSAQTAASPNDAKLTQLLIGTWAESRVVSNVRQDQIIRLKGDGAFVVNGKTIESGSTSDFTFHSVWRVEGGYFRYKTLASQPPEFFPAGEEFRDKIVSVSDQESVMIEQSTGQESRAKRLNSNVCQ